MNAKSLEKMPIGGSQLFMIKIRIVEKEADMTKVLGEAQLGEEPIKIQEVLDKYVDVFGGPTRLPPSKRVFDHHIPLIEGVSLVNSRPYRYSPLQKDVIKSMVREMTNQGTIQYNSSPYASLVVLVGKKDGSWRLCVDYKALNKATITDKFPIPVIKELLDELKGSQIYSKTDLRAGYH